MRGWTFMLGGLIIWTVHFFALYGIGSIFLTSTLARVLTILVSAACLAAAVLLWRRARRSGRREEVGGWMRQVALLGVGISAVAVVWQALPAILI